MPDDLLRAAGRRNAHNPTDVLEDDEAVGDILQEEARVFVKNDAVGHSRVLGHHRELHATVAHVSIEDPLQAALVTDLPIVHRADALSNWQNLGEFQLGEFGDERCLNSLNLIVKELNLMSTLLS